MPRLLSINECQAKRNIHEKEKKFDEIYNLMLLYVESRLRFREVAGSAESSGSGLYCLFSALA